MISLQSPDQNQCLVPHLKDLFHICLETKVQGFWMTFKVCNLDSSYPYLLHKIGCVDSLTHTTVQKPRYILLNLVNFSVIKPINFLEILKFELSLSNLPYRLKCNPGVPFFVWVFRWGSILILPAWGSNQDGDLLNYETVSHTREDQKEIIDWIWVHF